MKSNLYLFKEYGCNAVSGNFFFGNGHCNVILNTPNCKYDGGDCCLADPFGSDHSDHNFGQLPCIESRKNLSVLPFNLENIGSDVMDSTHKFKAGALLGPQEYCEFWFKKEIGWRS